MIDTLFPALVVGSRSAHACIVRPRSSHRVHEADTILALPGMLEQKKPLSWYALYAGVLVLYALRR